jgi:hypothetical protein
VLEKLSNFSARIVQAVKRDDGQQVELEFVVAGELNGQPLPPVRVAGEAFERMDWVLPAWEAQAIIEPGLRRKRPAAGRHPVPEHGHAEAARLHPYRLARAGGGGVRRAGGSGPARLPVGLGGAGRRGGAGRGSVSSWTAT